MSDNDIIFQQYVDSLLPWFGDLGRIESVIYAVGYERPKNIIIDMNDWKLRKRQQYINEVPWTVIEIDAGCKEVFSMRKRESIYGEKACKKLFGEDYRIKSFGNGIRKLWEKNNE